MSDLYKWGTKRPQWSWGGITPPLTTPKCSVPDMVSDTHKIGVEIAKTQDKVLIESVTDYARKNGFDELYIIDEEFVRTALLNEIERRKKCK